MTEVYPADHRRKPYPLGVRRQERKGRIALRLVRLGTAHDGVLPDVVGHPDAVEASLLRGPSDIRKVPGEPPRSSGPVEAVELYPEIHARSPDSFESCAGRPTGGPAMGLKCRPSSSQRPAFSPKTSVVRNWSCISCRTSPSSYTALAVWRPIMIAASPWTLTLTSSHAKAS